MSAALGTGKVEMERFNFDIVNDPAQGGGMQEQDLLDKLKKIERLHAGATTPGEMDAAADAIRRIRKRLEEIERTEPPIEYKFKLQDGWNKQLFIALLRRYAITPYRYSRQRRTTVMARLPRSFVNETLWPEYTELSKTLRSYLSEVTDRVIAEAIHAGTAEAEERAGEFLD